MSAPIVIDQTIADRLGPLPERFTVVPRRRLRWPLRGRSCAWRPLDPECVLEVLAGLADPGWALVRPIEHDCGARCLAAGAALLGHDVIRLPAAFDEAVWCVGVALRISESSDETLERVMDVVCCGPGAVPQSPRQPWGPTGLAVPALRPTTLARWAYCAWRPCGWCDGGGLAGHTCRRCGVLIDLVAAEVVA